MRVLEVKGNTEEKNSGKWKGYITASIAVPLEKTWQIGSDFSGLHKFVPIVEVCERLKGCNRTPGCLRFYTMNSATGLPGGKRKAWAKDRLLNIEEETHSYTYAVEGSNMNLENCQITFQASDGKDGTTVVTWAWELDPITKSTKEKTLSDMSEFGCTFIKGLEAAVATTDSIDFNFEGAPLDIDTLSDAGGDDDGGGLYSAPVPALSLMKGRLDTLTQSLNKICRRLESGPIPADLYQSELEILQSTLADGRRSLVNHLHGYMLDTRVGQSNKSFGTSDIAERYDEFKDCPLLSEKIISQNNDATETCKSDKGYEDCCLISSDKMNVSPQKLTSERVDALTGPDKAKARSTGDGQCQARSAKFPKLASEEDLRVEMDNASRCAYEAFQDFSNQFQSDLRDDISHQVESMGIRLEALGFLQESLNAGVKGGPSNIHPTTESQGGNNAIGAGPREGQEEAQFSTQESQISTQESSPDIRWPSSPSCNGARWPSSLSSNGTKGPSSPSSHAANVAPSPGFQTLEDDRGQFGVWELDALRSQRLQGSTKDIHSVRYRSRQLFQDLLQKEMSQDSDHRSHETKISPGTVQPTNSIQEIRPNKGCSPYCQFPLFRTQKSPHSQRPKPVMCRTAQNLQADLSRPPINENKLLDASSPESRDDEFHRHNSLPRPSRLPPEIWPDFPHEKSGDERYPVKERQVEDIPKEGHVEDVSVKRVIEDIAEKRQGEDWDNFELKREKFYSSPVSQENRDIIREPTSSSPPPPPLQSLENYMKILQLKSKSLPPRLSQSVEPVNQMMTSSSMLSLDKLGSEGTSSSQDCASSFGSINPSSNCPLSAAHPFVQRSEHVTLDLRNEIAPGVFHCRQGNQTRVVVNVPDDVETREEIRRHMRSLHRKDEIYKEFKLLGIQKPPTEQEILEGFAEARFKKQQELLALSETETPANDSPVFQPYYSDAKVWNPDVGHSPTVDKSRFAQGNDACTWDPASLSRFSAGHSTDAKPSSRQNAGQLSKTKYFSCNNATSREQLPNGRVFERMVESEQQVNVTNSFQKDASNMTSESLRGDSSARELAMSDSNNTQTPRGGFNGRQDCQPRVQTAELSTYRRSYPPVHKREFHIKGDGHRAPHCQPSSSNTKKKTKTGVSTLTESSSHATTTSSRDNACLEQMGSGDSFAHLERVDEISSQSASPEIRVYSQSGLLKRRDTPAMVASNLESRQSVASPQSNSESAMAKVIGNFQRDAEKNLMLELMRTRSSSQHLSLDEVFDKMPSGSGRSGFDPFRTSGSITYSDSNTTLSPEIRAYFEAQMLKANTYAINAGSALESRQSMVPPQSLKSSTHFSRPKILNNFPRDAEDFRLLEIMGNKRPSPQLSLDEVVNNAPSESGSSEFDPFRTSGKLGSITGSGSNTSSGHSFTGQLIGHVPHFTPSGKPINLTSAQSNPLIDSMSSDNLAECQKGRSHAMEPRRHEDCPFRQLKDKLDEVIHSSESSSPRHLDGRPHEINVRVSWADQRSECPGSSSSMGEGSRETSSSWKNLAFSAALDRVPQGYESSQQSEHGMPQPYGSSQQSDLNVIVEEPGEFFDHIPNGLGRGKSQRNPTPISHEVSGKLDTVKVQRTYRDAETQTDLPDEPEAKQNWSSETSQTPRPPGVEGLRDRQSIQKMASMASVAQFMDAQSSYSQMPDDVVGQTVESISSYEARKKREADELSFRTRQSAQMLNSMLNVREFSDDSRSYSVWLDGVVPLSVIQTPMKDSEAQTPMTDSEIQTPWNESESMVPREPRFREDSAANFLGSLKMQILQEFGDSKRTKADANDQLNPSLQEDSMAFLDALSKQIVKEYTDYTNNQSLMEGQSEGPRELRFREQSALTFLSALSENVLPEFRDRSGSRVVGVPGGGEPRFREKSAINFLTALREQIIQRNGRNSISKLPSTSDPLPRNQLHLTENANFQNAIQNEAYPDVNGNLQLDLKNQASSIESSNYQPESDGPGSPDESLTDQPASSEGQAYPDEGWSSQTKLDGQGTPGENLSYQPELEGPQYPDDTKLDGQGTPGENLSYQPELEGPQYPDDGLNYHPELEGTPDESSSHQPASEGQTYPGESSSFQLESEGQGTPGEKLSYPPDLEGQAYLDEGLSYQRESEGQSTPSVGRAYPDESLSFQPESEGRGTPGGKLSYRLDPLDRGFRDKGSRFQRNSEGQSTPGENVSDQPESEGGAYLDEGPSYDPKSEGQSSPGHPLDPEDLAFWDKGFSFEPESEGQSTLGENLSDEPDPEGEAYPNADLNDQPEGEAYADESLNDQHSPEGEADPDEGLDDQLNPEGEAYPGEGLDDQLNPEGEAYPDEGLDDQTDEGWNDQPNVEGEAYPDESLNEQPEDQGSENESGSSQQESQNQSQFGRNSPFQLEPRSSQRMSQRSSQVAQLNEMLQDLHTTVSRSRQNSVSNPGK